ncbi:sensor histidine kinase [Acidocella aromatica]|uniref:histidine kinase n=1 Tax=Acidocella aromatica TaxID=1303579 RepID=A0A840VAX4_9PROT|nr:HAMP domain-containing sensor histidine kinase [Acidocella aromatica]MBB5372923.1 hypothetical protein [Acidocella aromatica]
MDASQPLPMDARRTPETPRTENGQGQRSQPLIRSAGIRFALSYGVVFALAAFVLAFSLWHSTADLLQRQVQNAIHDDITLLTEHDQVGGGASVVAALQDRLANSQNADAIYLLVDANGNRLAGNLDQWPAGLTKMDSWYQLPVRRGGDSSMALLRALQLPTGEKLLVGRDVRALIGLHDTLRDAMIGAASLILVLGLLSILLIRALFRGVIRDISATTRAIAQGDLSRRVPRSGKGDEFDELAGLINHMLDRITRLMDGVRQVSNAIAHDLRTPITRARARLEDAAAHASSPEAMQNAIERATQDLDGIVRVFEALLRIAEIDAGARRAAFLTVDLSPMLRDMDELYRAVAEERGLHLETGIIAPLPVFGDRDLVQQAVANLLDNALKFSPPGEVIRLSAVLNGAMVEIVVADRGPGIAEADRNRATERFFRAEIARHTEGSGLGLALVAAVAQLHNGTLELEDNGPGLRAVFSIPAQLSET